MPTHSRRQISPLVACVCLFGVSLALDHPNKCKDDFVNIHLVVHKDYFFFPADAEARHYEMMPNLFANYGEHDYLQDDLVLGFNLFSIDHIDYILIILAAPPRNST